MELRYVRKAPPVVSDDGQLTGRAIAYDQWTMIGSKPWGFREKVNSKAANKTVNDGDMVLLDNHDTAKPLARQSAGTLILRNDGDGLDWDANPPDTTYAQDAIKNARAGNYGGCSFGFEVIRDKWSVGDDGIDEREILEAKVHEISICTFPAYDQTSVSARDQVDAAKEARDRRESKDTPSVTVSGTDYTDMASVLVSMYNALPVDQREAFHAAIEHRADMPSASDGQHQDHAPVTGSHTHAGADNSHTHNASNGFDHSERSEPVTATREEEIQRIKMRWMMVNGDRAVAEMNDER